jgi:phenylalanyl-tRNA synthetase beta chain
MALFDHYRGPGVPGGFRSLAYRLRFRHADRTLTDAEVNESVAKILSHLKESFSIAIR